jgi:hypothetical protein
MAAWHPNDPLYIGVDVSAGGYWRHSATSLHIELDAGAIARL